eukprot:6206188-Alexandrium_andersonii.AAC.1
MIDRGKYVLSQLGFRAEVRGSLPAADGAMIAGNRHNVSVRMDCGRGRGRGHGKGAKGVGKGGGESVGDYEDAAESHVRDPFA